MGVRTTQRIDYLDVLRGIATILVIFIHVSSSNWYGYIGSTNWYFFSFYESISRFAVPIFFMISGAMLLSPEKEITFPYIFKKIFRMIIFLIFWELMYALFNQRTSGFDFSNIIFMYDCIFHYLNITNTLFYFFMFISYII